MKRDVLVLVKGHMLYVKLHLEYRLHTGALNLFMEIRFGSQIVKVRLLT